MSIIFYFQKIIKERLVGLISSDCQSTIINCQWMRLLMGCLCFLFLSCGNSTDESVITVPKKEVLKSVLELRPNEGKMYHENDPFSGYSIRYYPENKLAEKIAYFQGKKEGLYQKWYPSGVLSFEANYQGGRKDGISKTWWKNGVLRSESMHKNGITHGNQRQWYKSGQLFKSMHIVNGQEEGLQQAWRANGKIYNNYEAKNGRIFGLKRANLCYELEEEVVQY